MNATRRWFIGSAAGVAALLVGVAAAQPGKRLPRIAIVFNSVPAAELTGADPASPHMRTFVRALRDLGLVEGRDIVIERRSAEDRRERLDPLMQELVALGVDVIVTGGPGVAAALRATDRIPIVGLVENPLDSGLIDNLARPRRNLTGFGGNFEGLIGKQLQLLKEAVPSISRVAVLATRQPPGPRARWRDQIDEAARLLQLDPRWVAVDAPADFEAAFATAVRERADALFATNSAVNFAHLRRIAEFAVGQRLPSFCSVREFAETGGLIAYGYGLLDDYRHAARFVKRIVDGAKPADLPFEQPTKFELVINLKTAKALGLTIRPSLLLRADEVIE